MIDPQLAIKLVFVLGWINLFGLLLVLFSCRCLLGFKPESLGNSKVYMKFYKYHCYYWWLFIISVALHAIIAITAFGNPFVQ